MEDFLTLVRGIALTLVYIDAIRIGFKDKSYAMPLKVAADKSTRAVRIDAPGRADLERQVVCNRQFDTACQRPIAQAAAPADRSTQAPSTCSVNSSGKVQSFA